MNKLNLYMILFLNIGLITLAGVQAKIQFDREDSIALGFCITVIVLCSMWIIDSFRRYKKRRSKQCRKVGSF